MHLVPPDPFLTGRWDRSLLATIEGLSDTTSAVTWLQAAHFYVDLRLPAAPLPPVSCLREVDAAQLAALAAVDGFAGRLSNDGPWAVWERLVDLQPATGAVDQGSLIFTGGVLVETGRDDTYLENWHRSTRPTSPVAALLLQEVQTGATAVAVQVGDQVGWARGRVPGTHQGVCLTDQQDHLDTEVALGRWDGAGVVLTSSNHPWRVGARLELAAEGGQVAHDDVTPDGSTVRHRWKIVDGEGHFPLLAGTSGHQSS